MEKQLKKKSQSILNINNNNIINIINSFEHNDIVNKHPSSLIFMEKNKKYKFNYNNTI